MDPRKHQKTENRGGISWEKEMIDTYAASRDAEPEKSKTWAGKFE